MQWQWQLDDASDDRRRAVAEAIASIARARRVAPRRLTRSLLDTFDERLAAGGHTLTVDSRKRGEYALCLRAIGAPQGEHWTSTRLPRRAADVSRPRLAARLARLTEGRALVTTCSAPLLLERVHWYDTLEKRIATIEIAGLAARRDRTALTFVDVTPVRGFEQACARILRGLRRGAFPDAQAVDAAATLRAARGGPVYRAKPVVDLRADEPAAHALARLFSAYGEVMWANEHGICEQIDTEFLHEYRVALRSIRSWSTELRRSMSKSARSHAKAELGALNRITGRVRDLDVLGERLPDYLADLGGVETSQRETLTALVAAARAPAQTRLAAHLRGTAYRHFKRQWRRLCRQLGHGRHLGREGGEPLREVVLEAVRRRHAAVLGFDWTRAQAEPALLHELRKECKKLRYLLEGFQRLFDASSCRRATLELKAVQTAMGDTWDLHVHHALLQALCGELPTDGHAARRVLPIVVGLGTRLSALEAAHVELVARAYQRFRSPPVQRIYRHLLQRPS